jgi:pyruvate ferredoxin oxidoreductase alpha subunit
VLDPDAPMTIGAMVGPDAFTEVRYLAHQRHREALTVIPRIADEFAQEFWRSSGGLVRPYGCLGAETVVVALGSVLGTLKDTVDELRAEGLSIGVLGVTTFRRVVVLERALAVGMGGIVAADVRGSVPEASIATVIAGLGGRPVTKASLRAMLTDAAAGRLDPLTFLDLKDDVVERELRRTG